MYKIKMPILGITILVLTTVMLLANCQAQSIQDYSKLQDEINTLKAEKNRADMLSKAKVLLTASFADSEKKKLAEYQDKLAEKIKNFSVKFDRWGDYLAFYVNDDGVKTIQSFPLLGAITLIEGKAPGLNGYDYLSVKNVLCNAVGLPRPAVYFRNALVYPLDFTSTCPSWSIISSDTVHVDDFAKSYKSISGYNLAITNCESFGLSSTCNNNNFFNDPSPQLKDSPNIITGLAYDYSSDKILINAGGFQNYITVPYGLGKKVYEDMLMAIKNGYEPNKKAMNILGIKE